MEKESRLSCSSLPSANHRAASQLASDQANLHTCQQAARNTAEHHGRAGGQQKKSGEDKQTTHSTPHHSPQVHTHPAVDTILPPELAERTDVGGEREDR